MSSTWFGWTRCSISSGRPGTQTLTSGSSAQKPKQPTGGQLHGEAAGVDLRGEGVETASAPLPEPQVPMPTAMRGLLGSSLARPASRTVGERGDVLDLHRALSLRSMLHLADERLLLDVAADRVVDLDDRREGALAEAGDGADREARGRAS